MKAPRILTYSVSAMALLTLVACGDDPADKLKGAVEPIANAAGSAAADVLPDMTGDDDTLSAVIGASEIPYPVYPNGSKYRVGGENGLKIVVFQTDDDFEQVDRYYREVSGQAGMPRLIAMNDYVRYSKDNEDKDPWATYRPGIVIHQFNTDDERQAVGAKGTARTNIIMSF